MRCFTIPLRTAACLEPRGVGGALNRKEIVMQHTSASIPAILVMAANSLGSPFEESIRQGMNRTGGTKDISRRSLRP